MAREIGSLARKKVTTEEFDRLLKENLNKKKKKETPITDTTSDYALGHPSPETFSA